LSDSGGEFVALHLFKTPRANNPALILSHFGTASTVLDIFIRKISARVPLRNTVKRPRSRVETARRQPSVNPCQRPKNFDKIPIINEIS
jgi:hypothetical protein